MKPTKPIDTRKVTDPKKRLKLIKAFERRKRDAARKKAAK